MRRAALALALLILAWRLRCRRMEYPWHWCEPEDGFGPGET
jgi:hypothetical protein